MNLAKLIIKHNYKILFLCFTLILISLTQLHKFRIDASSDTLVIEGNESLKYYKKIKERYGSDNFIIITYTPKNEEVFSLRNLDNFKALHKELEDQTEVTKVISIINAPLLNSPRQSFSEVGKQIINIQKNNFSNLTEVKQELINSPIYSNVLLSGNAETVSLLVWLKETNKESRVKEEAAQIKLIRDILTKYESNAQIFMGGIPMITSDSIAYIKSDIMVFGVIVIILISALLFISFREIRWVVIPLLNSAIICLITIALFAYIEWPATIISANFISLLLIISLSLSIHYIVHYQTLSKNNFNNLEIAAQTTYDKFKPCLYTAVTSIVAFSSLIVSNIKPVITFGYMMSVGIIVAFVITFLFIPAMASLLPRVNLKKNKELLIYQYLGTLFCKLLESRKILLTAFFLLLTIVSIIGINRLSVENSFINYYKKDTAIYQGMELIDRDFGGTTPLDVIIDAPQEFLEDEYSTKRNYWFNSFVLDDVAKIHNYLDSLPETGKILSLVTTIDTLKILNDNNVDSFFLAIVKKKISEEIKNILFTPYLSEDGNQIRFAIRIYELDTNLKRDELIKKIKNDIVTDHYIAPSDVNVTGMAVLYNDVLQTLFDSQILTLGIVFAAILIMFIILFRDVKIALIALIPNILSALIVLGIMGLFNIPLDIMTITIAAITVGISVDDTIHYIHKYLVELKKSQDPWQAIQNSHHTIGRAIYLTTITIIIGFSVLSLSNFVPTIYFGLLTGFAMLVALVADLLLLPIFLLLFPSKK